MSVFEVRHELVQAIENEGNPAGVGTHQTGKSKSNNSHCFIILVMTDLVRCKQFICVIIFLINKNVLLLDQSGNAHTIQLSILLVKVLRPRIHWY